MIRQGTNWIVIVFIVIVLNVIVSSCCSGIPVKAPKNGVQVRILPTVPIEITNRLPHVLERYNGKRGTGSDITFLGRGEIRVVIDVKPVEDPGEYSKKITCGKVTAIEGRVIYLDVDAEKLIQESNSGNTVGDGN